MSIIFDEPSAHYHANAATGSGDIRRMVKSARLFADGVDGLCERETAALLFGITSHKAFLEPDDYAATVAIKPDGMSFATKEGKAWREQHAGRLIVKEEDAAHLDRMRDRMPADVRAIFARCRTEVTVRTSIDGLAVQCRPDLWDAERREFWDLKTIDDADGIDGAIWSNRLDIQLGWYRRVLVAETAATIKRSGLIFAEKAPPYRWRVVEMDLDYQALADADIDEALRQISVRRRSGCWDDAGDLYAIASPPPWAEGRIPVDTEAQEA